MKKRAYIGLGSNLGSRRELIKKALTLLEEAGVYKVKTSSFYETEPVGGPLQDKYINAAAEIETNLTPKKLLSLFKDIEQKLGRDLNKPKWSAREIDLDILIYENEIISEDGLIIPHPLLHNRRFVLEPLAEIAPLLEHPVLRQSIANLFAALPEEKV